MVHLSSLAPVDFKFLIHCFSGNHSDYTYFLPRQLVTSPTYLALFYVLSHHRGCKVLFHSSNILLFVYFITKYVTSLVVMSLGFPQQKIAYSQFSLKC